VAEICRRAGVTKGAFYHHFSSKQTLFTSLLERWLNDLDAQLEAAAVGAATVPEKLLHMAEMFRPIFEMADGNIPIFFEFWTQAGHDPEIWQATIAPYRRYCTFFAHTIEAGIAEGTLRDVDPEAAAQILVSLAVGLLLQLLLDPQGVDRTEMAVEGVRMLLQGMERKE
jgi:AcrR family transcriptional regulator